MDTIRPCAPSCRQPFGFGGVAGLAALILVGACSSSTAPSVTAWSGNLAPRPPSRVSGTVGAVSQSGRTSASLELEGGESGAVYAWRILEGSCSSQGDALVGKAVYPQVSTGLSGTGTAQAGLAREMDYQKTYAAWVFLISPTDGSETVAACGELDRSR